eukprot:Rmarinus@m.19014
MTSEVLHWRPELVQDKLKPKLLGQSVKSFVRFRPTSQKSRDNDFSPDGGSSVSYDADENSVRVKLIDQDTTNKFDRVFTPEASNEEVFEYSCRPLVDSAILGFNSTLVAYGHKHTGKTHSLFGERGRLERGLVGRAIKHVFHVQSERRCHSHAGCASCSPPGSPTGSSPAAPPQSPGVASPSRSQSRPSHTSQHSPRTSSPRARVSPTASPTSHPSPARRGGVGSPASSPISTSPSSLSTATASTQPVSKFPRCLRKYPEGTKGPSDRCHLRNKLRDATVYVSCLVIYGEKVVDALSTKPPPLRVVPVQEGRTRRVCVGGLTTVKTSSPAEAFAALRGASSAISGGSPVNIFDEGGVRPNAHVIVTLDIADATSGVCGRMMFVDLAGWDKHSVSDPRVCASRPMRGKGAAASSPVNMTLAIFSKCVNDLAKKSHHVPFRDSRLCRLLQGALTGNCRTSFLVTCSPLKGHVFETAAALKIASAVQGLMTYPAVNTLHGDPRIPTDMEKEFLHATDEVGPQHDADTEDEYGTRRGMRRQPPNAKQKRKSESAYETTKAFYARRFTSPLAVSLPSPTSSPNHTSSGATDAAETGAASLRSGSSSPRMQGSHGDSPARRLRSPGGRSRGHKSSPVGRADASDNPNSAGSKGDDDQGGGRRRRASPMSARATRRTDAQNGNGDGAPLPSLQQMISVDDLPARVARAAELATKREGLSSSVRKRLNYLVENQITSEALEERDDLWDLIRAVLLETHRLLGTDYPGTPPELGLLARRLRRAESSPAKLSDKRLPSPRADAGKRSGSPRASIRPSERPSFRDPSPAGRESPAKGKDSTKEPPSPGAHVEPRALEFSFDSEGVLNTSTDAETCSSATQSASGASLPSKGESHAHSHSHPHSRLSRQASLPTPGGSRVPQWSSPAVAELLTGGGANSVPRDQASSSRAALRRHCRPPHPKHHSTGTADGVARPRKWSSVKPRDANEDIVDLYLLGLSHREPRSKMSVRGPKTDPESSRPLVSPSTAEQRVQPLVHPPVQPRPASASGESDTSHTRRVGVHQPPLLQHERSLSSLEDADDETRQFLAIEALTEENDALQLRVEQDSRTIGGLLREVQQLHAANARLQSLSTSRSSSPSTVGPDFFPVHDEGLKSPPPLQTTTTIYGWAESSFGPLSPGSHENSRPTSSTTRSSPSPTGHSQITQEGSRMEGSVVPDDIGVPDPLGTGSSLAKSGSGADKGDGKADLGSSRPQVNDRTHVHRKRDHHSRRHQPPRVQYLAESWSGPPTPSTHDMSLAYGGPMPTPEDVSTFSRIVAELPQQLKALREHVDCRTDLISQDITVLKERLLLDAAKKATAASTGATRL